MKEYNKFGVEELTKKEAEKISGGILGAIALAIATFGVGYNLGKDLYHIVNK